MIFLVTHLDNLGSPTTLPKSQDLTTEVVPPDSSAIVLELNMICENYREQKNINTMLRGNLILDLINQFRTVILLFLAKVCAKNT